MKPAALLATIFLALVALAHLLRLIFQVELVADGVSVPMWLSVFGVLAPGGIAVWLWREQARAAT